MPRRYNDTERFYEDRYLGPESGRRRRPTRRRDRRDFYGLEEDDPNEMFRTGRFYNENMWESEVYDRSQRMEFDRPSMHGVATGPHMGHGPKGYRRSPENIRDDIYEALTNHPDVDAQELSAEVSGDGVVTLKGSVPRRRMRLLAEDAVANIQGVVDVHNQIQIIR